jgi:hypothetical protein
MASPQNPPAPVQVLHSAQIVYDFSPNGEEGVKYRLIRHILRHSADYLTFGQWSEGKSGFVAGQCILQRNKSLGNYATGLERQGDDWNVRFKPSIVCWGIVSSFSIGCSGAVHQIVIAGVNGG